MNARIFSLSIIDIAAGIRLRYCSIEIISHDRVVMKSGMRYPRLLYLIISLFLACTALVQSYRRLALTGYEPKDLIIDLEIGLTWRKTCETFAYLLCVRRARRLHTYCV